MNSSNKELEDINLEDINLLSSIKKKGSDL
jgi:hypothetical protein